MVLLLMDIVGKIPLTLVCGSQTIVLLYLTHFSKNAARYLKNKYQIEKCHLCFLIFIIRVLY